LRTSAGALFCGERLLKKTGRIPKEKQNAVQQPNLAKGQLTDQFKHETERRPTGGFQGETRK